VKAEDVALAVCRFVNERPAAKQAQTLYHRVVGNRFVQACIGRRIRAHGLERVIDMHPDRGVLLCANHRSFFDQYAIMSILYIVRRNNPSEPGVGSMELERLLECPEPVIRFHCWYLKENNWITRLDTGYMAITAHGVDRLFELGYNFSGVVNQLLSLAHLEHRRDAAFLSELDDS